MKIKLVCDSLCDIPKEIMEKEYIEIVPLTIMVDDKEFREGVDINKQEFYDLVKKINVIPKTSQATYMEFKEVFDKYIAEGYEIICLTGAANTSGTFQSATLAKNDTDQDKIHVFDTRNLSLGSGQYVIKACELLESGMDANEIVEELESIYSSVRLIFMPYTLNFLKKSGRVPITTALVGNMLNIKPIFFFDDGEAKLVNKVRGSKQVATKLVDMILELCKGKNIENMIFTIGCGDNIEDIDKLEEEVKKRINCRRLLFTRGGVAICSHTGPDILAISCSN
ncbi:DegV family protein [Metaclostridioides mangenotii]|uniref:DegV family protein with EDD domain n=1 Tax=Metaclostridioides mangenotii TaxID=1540 RepID=A0ABS4E999_9FIRM|nr:DegV family protein [Clostridioides mangenotii]MBP1854488.1 DegV family protein with EDD domain [Clostridioides mangenotii]